MTGSTVVIKPVSTSSYPTVVIRPAYSVLNKTKIQKNFEVKLKDWKKSLENCIKKIK